MFALLIGIDEMLEWLFPQYRDRLNKLFSQATRRKVFWGALVVFVFVSGFLAWKEEHSEVNDQRTKIGSLETEAKGVLEAR